MSYRFSVIRLAMLALGAAGTAPSGLVAQAPAPEYAAQGNRLVHDGPGGYAIEVESGLRYVGGRRFHIRDAADAEQHLFVESAGNGRVQRLVWIQIESQLPGQNWRYKYPSPDRTKLGDLSFIADAMAWRTYEADDSTSDHAVMERQLHEHQLVFPGPVMRLRMIYLPDAEHRRELMVIYAVAMPDSLRAAIPEDGADAGRWPLQLARLKASAERDVKVRLAK